MIFKHGTIHQFCHYFSWMVLKRLDVQTYCKQNERERGKERKSHRQQRWVTERQTNQRLCLKPSDKLENIYGHHSQMEHCLSRQLGGRIDNCLWMYQDFRDDCVLTVMKTFWAAYLESIFGHYKVCGTLSRKATY